MIAALRELLRIPITFVAADGSRVDSPMISAEVAGIETLLILDTGSDAQLLTRELADRIGLALKSGEDGTDHAGTTMPSWSFPSTRGAWMGSSAHSTSIPVRAWSSISLGTSCWW